MTDEHDDQVAAAFAGLRDEVEDSVDADASLSALHARSGRRALPRVVTVLGAVAAVAVLVVAGTFVVRSGDPASVNETADGGPSASSTAPSTTSPDDAGAIDCDEPSIHVYLEPGVTAEQVAEVQRQLEQIDPGSPWTYVDSAATYAEAERLFAESPDFLTSLDPADLPPSFRRIVEGELTSESFEQLNDIPGVLRAEGTSTGFRPCADAVPKSEGFESLPAETTTTSPPAAPTIVPSTTQAPTTAPPTTKPPTTRPPTIQPPTTLPPTTQGE